MTLPLKSWEPSDAQLRLLAAFQRYGYKIKTSAACTEAGVGLRTYYTWHDHPDFSAWWTERANHWFRLQLHRVHAATLSGATKQGAPGSPRDRQIYYERFDRDYCPRQRQEISGEIEVTHGVDPTELCQLAAEAMSARPAGQPDVAAVGADDGDAQQKPATPVA